MEDLYESVSDREIRQVFEGQNRIHLEIKQLHRQLAMILDEQRRYVSVITDEVSKKATNAESGQVSWSLFYYELFCTIVKHVMLYIRDAPCLFRPDMAQRSGWASNTIQSISPKCCFLICVEVASISFFCKVM